MLIWSDKMLPFSRGRHNMELPPCGALQNHQRKPVRFMHCSPGEVRSISNVISCTSYIHGQSLIFLLARKYLTPFYFNQVGKYVGSSNNSQGIEKYIFIRSLFKHLSTSNHPQSDGQIDITIQTVDDILRACILESGSN